MRHQILEKPIVGINPYKELGRIIARLRFANSRNILTQEKLGNLLNLNRQTVTQIESGNRRLDLFEVKDIATVFRYHSPKMAQLRLVLELYLPQGNPNNLAIYEKTGQLIYNAREVAYMSRCGLARQTGIERGVLWRMESGNTRVYLLEAWAIARVLKEDAGFRALDDALSNLLLANQTNQLPNQLVAS